MRMGYCRRGTVLHGVYARGVPQKGKINENIITTQKEIEPVQGSILKIMGTCALRG